MLNSALQILVKVFMLDSGLMAGTLGSALALLAQLCLHSICSGSSVSLLSACVSFLWCWIFISPFPPALPAQVPRRTVGIDLHFCFCSDYCFSYCLVPLVTGP